MDDNRSRGGFWSAVVSWARCIVVAFGVALFVNNFLIANATVTSGSMESTVMTGSRVFCNRLAYINAEPQRYDVILFHFDQVKEGERWFKRIIGLPGETVEIRDGKVYINNETEPLPDYFVNEDPYGDYGPYQVPEDCYFVLGDNRNRSFDSKLWDDPFVPREDIMGKAVLMYYPEIKGFESIE